MQLQNQTITSHTISASIRDLRHNHIWMITWIYGPQGDFDKQMFVRELRQLKHSALPGWLLIEDFNLIYKD
jgi:hypothetical protein